VCACVHKWTDVACIACQQQVKWLSSTCRSFTSPTYTSPPVWERETSGKEGEGRWERQKETIFITIFEKNDWGVTRNSTSSIQQVTSIVQQEISRKASCNCTKNCTVTSREPSSAAPLFLLPVCFGGFCECISHSGRYLGTRCDQCRWWLGASYAGKEKVEQMNMAACKLSCWKSATEMH